METTAITASAKGIVLGLILALFALASYFLKLEENKTFQYVTYLVFLGGIIGSIVIYGKQINHQSTFGNYFAHGFKVCAIITAIILVFILILTFIFPDFKQRALETIQKSMVEKKQPKEQIDGFMKIISEHFVPFILGTTMLAYLFFGVVASLLGAAFTKKNPVQHFDNLEQNNQ